MTLKGHASGETYDADQDYARLNKQREAVWRVMHSGEWRSLAEIAAMTGHPEASVSARLRDFRKTRFGSHTVDRLRKERGLFLYRLIKREEQQ